MSFKRYKSYPITKHCPKLVPLIATPPLRLKLCPLCTQTPLIYLQLHKHPLTSILVKKNSKSQEGPLVPSRVDTRGVFGFGRGRDWGTPNPPQTSQFGFGSVRFRFSYLWNPNPPQIIRFRSGSVSFGFFLYIILKINLRIHLVSTNK